jgi:hypothetical protein
MIFLGESDWEFRPLQRSRVFSVDVPNLPGIRSSLSVAFDSLATFDDEVDLTVGHLECAIGVSPFGRWWWSPLLAVVVAGTLVVLATSIITPVVSLVVVTINTVIITTIASAVIAPVIAVVEAVVVTSVIATVVAAIITSIPIVVARIGSTVTVSLRSRRRLRLSKR